MSSTKLRSFQETSRTAPTVRERIYQFLTKFGPASRARISESLNLIHSSVCARVNELLRLGLIEKAGEVWDTQTRRNVELLRVREFTEVPQAAPLETKLRIFNKKIDDLLQKTKI